MKDRGIDYEHYDDDENKAKEPIDYEFIYGLGEKGLDSPRMPLPSLKDPLYVVKPIY